MRAESQISPVNLIAPYPLMAAAAGPRRAHHLQGKLRFGEMFSPGLRYFRPGAARLILSPRLRQKQPEIHQRRVPSPAKAGKNPHLTVFRFPQPSAVLPLHAHGELPFLHEAGLIQIEGGVAVSAQQSVGIGRRLLQERLMTPRGVGDELLQALVIALRHIGFDAFNILAPLRAQQAGEIMPGVPADILPVHREMVAVIAAQLHERGCGRPQAREIIFYLAVPPEAGTAWVEVEIMEAPWMRRSGK